jgi:hypothetical protein
VREPVTRAALSAEWTTRRIIAEAKKAGISEIGYIDVRTISLLLGIYSQRVSISSTGTENIAQNH